MNPGQVIAFDKKKFTFIKPLGSGGTGSASLFRDETTDMLFAIKKYDPKDINFLDENFSRFVEEIKILLNISHPNIVRIYDYYLYPNVKTGYLQMEYIEGQCINQYDPMSGKKSWNEIFCDLIDAFVYLEKNKILHRDIRPANILIDKNGNVKIIDFGFGKMVNDPCNDKNSIILNWPATEMPEEVEKARTYDERTEIYYLGILFAHLLRDKISDFNYSHIVEKMVKVNPKDRYESFSSIASDLTSGVLAEICFSEDQKKCYLAFMDKLTSHIINFYNGYSLCSEPGQIIEKLAEVIRSSSLERYNQNNGKLIECFVNGGFIYKTTADIPVRIIIEFYRFFVDLDSSKRKLVLKNIMTRFSSISVKFDPDDLPF